MLDRPNEGPELLNKEQFGDYLKNLNFNEKNEIKIYLNEGALMNGKNVTGVVLWKGGSGQILISVVENMANRSRCLLNGKPTCWDNLEESVDNFLSKIDNNISNFRDVSIYKVL